MEDSSLDLDAPLLSVGRFSGGSADAESGDADQDKVQFAPESCPPSVSFQKSDLTPGPVRNPGVVPFVWEKTPGQPKNGSAAGNSGEEGEKAVFALKPPPGRIFKNKAPSEEQSASSMPPTRTGSSVRTRKTVTFAPDAGAAKTPPAEDSSKKAVLEKEKEHQKIGKGSEKVVTFEPDALAVKPPPPAEDNSKKATVEKEKAQQPIRKGDVEDEDDDAFSDAPDTLSRAESFFMNCSVSGLSGITESAEPATGFSTDPQVREFMMGRFLPAAKAMASDTPQYTFRKTPLPSHESRPSERVNGQQRRPPVSFQHKHYDISRYVKQQQLVAHDVNSVDDDDDEDDDDAGQLPSKGCGFLPSFCLKSSFFLLNPVPGIKVRGHLPAPPRRGIRRMPIKSSLNGPTEHPGNEHSWQAVYRHKLGQGHYRHEVEDNRSKLTSEPIQLTNWSDSPSADGFSSLRHSTGGGISPYKEVSQSPFHEGKGLLGVPSRESKSNKTDASNSFEKDGENYWEITPHHHSHLNSGSIRPALVKTLHVDSVDVLETYDPDSSSFTTVSEARVMSYCEKGSEVEIRRRIEERYPVKACQADVLKPKVFNFVEPVHSETTIHKNTGGERNLRKNGSDKVQLHFHSENARKKFADPLQPILPPPLPKSPSESWLSRTLSSAASNEPVPQSLLGIGCQWKQALQTPSADMKQFQNAKTSKPQCRQIRFAEVLVKPNSPKSEI